jgi:hypothetical protein
MSVYTIGLASFLYLITALDCYRQKDYPHAGMWLSYFFANFFMIVYELGKSKL